MSKKLVIYLVAEPETPELARAAVEGGADIVELGFPFSDPLAEGPVIRRASERALARGMRTRACLDVLARTRELLPETPLVPMTYAAILEAYGYERFAADARERGASSFILVDLPVEEQPALRRIQLVAPTSTEERIRAAAGGDRRLALPRFRHGTTGARTELSPALPPFVERVRAATDVPVYVGFGISTPELARAVARAGRRRRRRLAGRRGRRERSRRAAQLRRVAPSGARRLLAILTGSSQAGLTWRRKHVSQRDPDLRKSAGPATGFPPQMPASGPTPFRRQSERGEPGRSYGSLTGLSALS